MVGGNFLETLPDADAIAPRARAGRASAFTTTSCCRRRCSSESDGDVLILRRRRATNRRRRHRDVDRAAHHLFAGDSRPADRIGAPRMVGVRRGDGARESRAGQLRALRRAPRRSATRSPAPCRSTRASRRCSAKGDQVQWGGRTLYADGRFATPDGKAHFAAVDIGRRRRRAAAVGADASCVSTRRGKQFNSMIQREVDPLTGARRDEVLISEAIDAPAAGGGRRGPPAIGRRNVRREAENGAHQARQSSRCTGLKATACCSGSLIDPDSMEPDYNATVTIEPLTGEGGRSPHR